MNKDCPDYLPMYTAIDRFGHWVNHAQLDNAVWDQLFAIAKEHGFDAKKPTDGDIS